jgi:hypothetical protein
MPTIVDRSFLHHSKQQQFQDLPMPQFRWLFFLLSIDKYIFRCWSADMPLQRHALLPNRFFVRAAVQRRIVLPGKEFDHPSLRLPKQQVWPARARHKHTKLHLRRLHRQVQPRDRQVPCGIVRREQD